VEILYSIRLSRNRAAPLLSELVKATEWTSAPRLNPKSRRTATKSESEGPPRGFRSAERGARYSRDGVRGRDGFSPFLGASPVANWQCRPDGRLPRETRLGVRRRARAPSRGRRSGNIHVHQLRFDPGAPNVRYTRRSCC